MKSRRTRKIPRPQAQAYILGVSYALGTAVCSWAFGIFPVGLDMSGGSTTPDRASRDLVTASVIALAQAVLWGLWALSARGLDKEDQSTWMITLPLVHGALKGCALFYGREEMMRPSLFPGIGVFVCSLCDVLLSLSFLIVVEVARAEAEDVSVATSKTGAAAASWVVIVGLLGAVAAPALYLTVACAVVGMIGLVFLVARWGVAETSTVVRTTWLSRRGIVTFVLGLALAALRVAEHRDLSQPGRLAVYEHRYSHCTVDSAGVSETPGVSLWEVRCSLGGEPSLVVLGWDQRQKKLFQVSGEETAPPGGAVKIQ